MPCSPFCAGIASKALAPSYSAFPGGSSSSVNLSLSLPSSNAYTSVVGNVSAIASSDSLGYSTTPEPLFLPASSRSSKGLLKPESAVSNHRRSPVPVKPVQMDPKGKGRAMSQDVPSVTHETHARPVGSRKLGDTVPAVDIADAVRFAGLMPPARSIGRDVVPASPPRGEVAGLARTTSAQSARTESDTTSLQGTIASTSSAVDTGAESLKAPPAKKKKKQVNSKDFPEQRHGRPKEPFTQVILGSALTNANLDVRRPVLQASMGVSSSPAPIGSSAKHKPPAKPSTAQSSQPARRREERAARRPRPAEASLRSDADEVRPVQSSTAALQTSQAPSARPEVSLSAAQAVPASHSATFEPTRSQPQSAEPAPPPWTAPQSTITLAFTPMHAYIADFEQSQGELDEPDSPTTAAFMAALGQSSPSVQRLRRIAAEREPDSPPPEFRSRPPSPQVAAIGGTGAIAIEQAEDDWPEIDPDSVSVRSRGYRSSEDEADLLAAAKGSLASTPGDSATEDATEIALRRWQLRRWEAWRRQGIDAEQRWRRLHDTGHQAVDAPNESQSVTSVQDRSSTEVQEAPPSNNATVLQSNEVSVPIESLVPPRPIADPPVTTSTTAEAVARVQEAVRIPSSSTLLRPQPGPLPAREPSPAPSGSSSSEPRSSLVSEPKSGVSASRFPSLGTVRRARLARFEQQRQTSKTMSSVIDTSPASSAVGLPIRKPTLPAASQPIEAATTPASARGSQSAQDAVADKGSPRDQQVQPLAPNLTIEPAHDGSRQRSGTITAQTRMPEQKVPEQEVSGAPVHPGPTQSIAKRLSAEIEARNAVLDSFGPLASAQTSNAEGAAAVSPIVISPLASSHSESKAAPAASYAATSAPSTPKAKKKRTSGAVANRISRLIKSQTASKQPEQAQKDPPEMTLPRAPPRVTTDPLSVDNLRRLSRHQERPVHLRSSLSQSSSSEQGYSDSDSESSFENRAKSDSDSDSADDESTRKPASTLISFPGGAPPPSATVSSLSQSEDQKEVAAASWRRSEDGRRHSALLSRPLSIKRKPPPVPAKRWGGFWDKSVQLFDNFEQEVSNALAERSTMPGSFLSRVREDEEEEPEWQTVGQPQPPVAPRLPSFSWETAGRDEPVPGAVARAIAALSVNDRTGSHDANVAPRAQPQLPRRLPPLPVSAQPSDAPGQADQTSHVLAEQATSSRGSVPHDMPARQKPLFATLPKDGSVSEPSLEPNEPLSAIAPLRTSSNTGSLRRTGATRRPQSVSHPRQALPSPPVSPNGSAYPPDGTRASLNARPRHVYSNSLPVNSFPGSPSRPRRPLPTPPADVTLPEGVIPAFEANRPSQIPALGAPIQQVPSSPEGSQEVVEHIQPADGSGHESLDAVLADIEGSGVSPVSCNLPLVIWHMLIKATANRRRNSWPHKAGYGRRNRLAARRTGRAGA